MAKSKKQKSPKMLPKTLYGSVVVDSDGDSFIRTGEDRRYVEPDASDFDAGSRLVGEYKLVRTYIASSRTVRLNETDVE